VDTDVRAVFSWSYKQLGPEPAKLFRLFGVHPGPDISVPAAASLAGVPPQQISAMLAQLASVHLITEHLPGRYTSHDLLRAYAAELAHSDEPEHERQAALRRVLDHYLHTAYAASRVLYPHGNPITLADPAPGVTLESLVAEGQFEETQQQAMDWFAAEHPVLLGAVDTAYSAGFDTHTWQLTWTLADFLSRRARYHDRAATLNRALEAVRRLSDQKEEANTHCRLARAYDQLSRHPDAHRHRHEALNLYDEIGDQPGQANIHLDLANTLEAKSPHVALEHAQQALKVFPDRPGQARALNAVAWCQARVGDEQALNTGQQALTLMRELGNSYGEAAAADTLAYAHHQFGQHQQAIAHFQHALGLYRGLQDQVMEADTLDHLGDTHQATGDIEATHICWQQALDILDKLHHPQASQIRSKLHELDQPNP
jgi:tetratricopeptide (TPR) repeat protein